MASRAHVIHDYSFAKHPSRPRYRTDDDPVVLPRSKSDLSARSVFAALIASGLVVASSYALFSSPVPMLGETQAASLTRDWRPNPDVEGANVTNELSGPAMSVPSIATASNPADFESDTPIMSPAKPDEVIIDDSLQLRSMPPVVDPTPIPEVQPAPSPNAPTPQAQPPYPNPTTTPPDGIAPDVSPATPTPPLDPQNPYR
jgi:hypothetical protein